MPASNAEAAFCDAAGAACSAVDREVLVEMFRRVTPPARTWCLEIDGAARARRPDFCFALPGVVEMPDALADAASLRMLRQLVGADAADGRWFFELDDGADERGVHSFVRLRHEARASSALVARLRARTPATCAAAVEDFARFVEEANVPFALSDVGVVVRDGRAQIRLGLLPPAAAYARFLVIARAELELRNAFDVLVPAVVSHDRCALQLALPTDRTAARCTGVEIGVPDAVEGWERLLGRLVLHGWLDDRLRRAALAWRGRERLASEGGRWPRILAREISHVKLVIRDGTVVTKVYLVASETRGLFV